MGNRIARIALVFVTFATLATGCGSGRYVRVEPLVSVDRPTNLADDSVCEDLWGTLSEAAIEMSDVAAD